MLILWQTAPRGRVCSGHQGGRLSGYRRSPIRWTAGARMP